MPRPGCEPAILEDRRRAVRSERFRRYCFRLTSWRSNAGASSASSNSKARLKLRERMLTPFHLAGNSFLPRQETENEPSRPVGLQPARQSAVQQYPRPRLARSSDQKCSKKAARTSEPDANDVGSWRRVRVFGALVAARRVVTRSVSVIRSDASRCRRSRSCWCSSCTVPVRAVP